MNKPENFDEILSEIRSALERFLGHSKTGAHVHKIITETAPGLNIRSIVEIPSGPGALTKFINTYLHETLHRIGTQGGDVLYGIGNVTGHVPEQQDIRIWKAFVSPSSKDFLCIDMSKSKLFVAESLDLDDNTHHIERVTEGEHDSVRDAFQSELSESLRNLIDTQTEFDSSYDTFIHALRTTGQLKLWGRYRRESLKSLLGKRLEEIPLEKKLIPSAQNQLMDSQRALFHTEEKRQEEKREISSDLPKSVHVFQDSSELNTARSLASSVIDHLSYDEIRAIHVPFGAVLDALNTRK